MITLEKILLVIIITFSSVYANEKINLVTEVFPPFQYKIKDKTIGIDTDIVNAIQKEIDSNSKIEVCLWSKALDIVNNNKNTAIFSMLRTAERENKYKWVGPLASIKVVFFKKKDSNITLDSIEDAKKVKRIGVTKGVANYEMLHKQGFTNLVLLKNEPDEDNIKKLVNGSIDLWPTPLKSGYYNARLQGLAREVEPIKNVIAFSGDLYLAFNTETNNTIVQKWQNALDKLKREKIIEKITRRYENTTANYNLLIKILGAILFILGIVVYHNRKLSQINKKLYQSQEELREQTYRDPLTNLYNRRYFYNMAADAVHTRKRENKDIGVILIDIDNFKIINDSYGHPVGDEVIKNLASTLVKNTRDSDIVARIGGEEFAILLPYISLEETIFVAEKIRKIVENDVFKIDNTTVLKYTISSGVDSVLEGDEKIEASLKRADKALYKAKKRGRNQVCTN